MADPFALGGKHVLITGGSSGLGRFFAETLAARGASVTIAARRAEALAKTVEQISEQKGLAQSVVSTAKTSSVRSRPQRDSSVLSKSWSTLLPIGDRWNMKDDNP